MTIYPTSTINHTTRIQLGLSSIDMIVSEYYLYRSMTYRGFEFFAEPAATTAEILGLKSSQVTASDKTLMQEGYLQTKGAKKRITEKYLMAVKVAVSGQKVSPSHYELARYFLDTLRDVAKENGINIKPPSSSNKASLKSVALLIQNISGTEVVKESDLEMIIRHKLQTWGLTDQKQYIRPATLLRSAAKYREYKLNAQQYWKTKLT